MRSILYILISAVLFNCAILSASAQNSEGQATGLTTLFAIDPLTQALCLRDGMPGLVFQQGQKRNRCSELNFGSYEPDSFSVGVEGARQGVIIDLGTATDLKARYGYSETVGAGQGFASITARNKNALILKDNKTGQLQEMTESKKLFGTPANSFQSVPVQLGHVYLIRLTDSYDKSFELIAKLLVVAYVPGQSVTVRWSLLSDEKNAKL